jgi:hypothetical protein
MEGTHPAAMREFFLVGAGKFLRCHKLAPSFAFFEDFECYPDVTTVDSYEAL